MTRHQTTRTTLARPLARAIALAALVLAVAAGPALAHGPDPLLGNGALWGRDEVATYMWNSTYTPPAWLATAFDAGAADANASQGARAATYLRNGTSPAVITYSGPLPCDSYGIACMNRTGATTDGTFWVWFRPQGWAFDWGTLKWCQFYKTPPNGCYDAEQTSLDELGHVEVLGHHANYADESDFLDAVVQFAGRQKPNPGWNTHAFGRCDVARLQLEYDRQTTSNLVSTCLSLTSAITFSASTDSIGYGESVKFSATLKIAIQAAAESMSGDALSNRAISLQRRPIGGSTWSTVTTLGAGTTPGAYSLTLTPTATYDWRVSFATPSNEGLSGATSAVLRVYVSTCTGAGCPLSAAR